MRTIASIEARMTSTRLPGKMNENIGGLTALEHVITRVKRVPEVSGIVVCTPEDPVNKPLWDVSRKHSVLLHKGSEDNVLRRVTDAHRECGTETVVRVCGDQVFLDPGTVSDAIKAHEAGLGEMITTTRESEYPTGVDAEVFSYFHLKMLNNSPYLKEKDREHVSLYWYEHPESYAVYEMQPHPALHMPDLRLCLDTTEDLTYAREIVHEFGWDCDTSAILRGIRHGRLRKLVERSRSDQVLPSEWGGPLPTDSAGLLEGTAKSEEPTLRNPQRGEAETRRESHSDLTRLNGGYRPSPLKEDARERSRNYRFENGGYPRWGRRFDDGDPRNG